MNKSFEIYKHVCLEHKPITQREAIEKFNSYRLASVIHRLREDGFNIQTIMTREKGTTYATYLYKPQVHQEQ
tara:strand:- start:2601 stop:2816 length:216 start_codon:yes stop_codon:yes gene_type:complete